MKLDRASVAQLHNYSFLWVEHSASTNWICLQPSYFCGYMVHKLEAFVMHFCL